MSEDKRKSNVVMVPYTNEVAAQLKYVVDQIDDIRHANRVKEIRLQEQRRKRATQWEDEG